MRKGIPALWAAAAAVAICSFFIEPVAYATAGTPFISACPVSTVRAAQNENFAVWICQADAQGASEAANTLVALKNYYPRVSTLLATPYADGGGVAEGGSARIDVYLLDQGQSVTRQGATHVLGSDSQAATVPTDIAGTAGSGYLLLSRVSAQTTGATLNAIVTHELFHLAQFVTNIGDCDGAEWWFTEASAQWAEWYLVPAARSRSHAWFQAFQRASAASLLDPNGPDATHSYDDWIWPLYMYQRTGNTAAITNVWDQAASLTDCTSLNSLVDSQVSFAANFQDFAVRNFDTKLPVPGSSRPDWPVDFGLTYQQIPDASFPVGLPALTDTRRRCHRCPRSTSRSSRPTRRLRWP
jgi:hypothetical protein